MAWPNAENDKDQISDPSDDKIKNTKLVELISIVKLFYLGTKRLTWKRLMRFIPVPSIVKSATLALNCVSLSIKKGEILGLVGESGSGKSTLGRIMLRLIDPSSGEILFDNREISRASERELRPFRPKAQIVFQNPTSSLNPRRTVGDTIRRSIVVSGRKVVDFRAEAEALMNRVGLPSRYYGRYPHQLSGGEKQRVGIARALASNPELIVCDEPVSALDMSVQATVLNLFLDLRREFRLAYLFISHDLAVISHVADRIVVLYFGHIVEEGPTDAVLHPPYHPYTEILLSSATSQIGTTQQIVSVAESMRYVGRGCIFQNRCMHKLEGICELTKPPIIEFPRGHRIACHIRFDKLVLP
jgi:peptide/nickel transport system ATP-binding protein